MAMFDDPKKELKQLQDKLLQDEEWFERELDSAKRMIGELPEKKTGNPAAHRAGMPRSTPVSQRPAPVSTGKPNVSSRLVGMGNEDLEEYDPPKKGIRGLVILAVLETLGIVGVVAYWMLFLLK